MKEFRMFFLVTETLETCFGGVVELTRLNSYHMLLQFNKFLKLMKVVFFFFPPASCSVLLWLVKTSLFAQIFLNLTFLN